jgi:hypothetical protein
MAIPACFWISFPLYIVSHHFTVNLCMSLLVRYVSCRQQILGSRFVIQSVSLCLLTGELSLFAFRVIIKRCFLIPAILLAIFFGWFYYYLFFSSTFINLWRFLVCQVDYDWSFPNSHVSTYSFVQFILSWVLMFVTVFLPPPCVPSAMLA